MKKIRKSLLILAVGMVTYLLPVKAEELPTVANSKGLVTFKERSSGGNGNIIVPETKPPIEVAPVNPSPSSPEGPLMIVDAPLFDFGTVEISSRNSLYSTKTTAYYQLDETGQVTAEKKYSAPILQIEDVRGNTTQQVWSLSVSATPFRAADVELVGAEIRVQRPSLIFNNTVAEERAPEGITTTAAGYTISTAAQRILYSDPGKGNGLTSLVFDQNYQAGQKSDGTDYGENELINDVQLFVPVTANKQKEIVYQATVTWSLHSTPESTPPVNSL